MARSGEPSAAVLSAEPGTRLERGLPADFAWLAGGYGVRSLAWLATATLLARELGPAGFGALSLFMALAAAVGYLAGSWPFLSLPMAVAEKRALGPVLRAALKLAAGTGVLCAAVVLPVAVVMLDAGGAELALLLLYGAALIALQAVYGVLQADGRMPAIASTQAAERVLTLALVALVLVTAGLTVEGAEVAIAVAAAVLGFASLARVLGRQSDSAAGDAVDRRALLSLVGPMAVVTTCSYVIAWVDVVILGALASDAEVGRYALAYQVFAFVTQFAALSIVAALPRHAHKAAAGVSMVPELLPGPMLLRVSAAWGAVAALFAVAAALALEPVFGSAYGPGIGPLALLLAGLALAAPYYALVPVVVALGRTKPLALIGVASVVVNIVTGIALVPLVGIWGPAVATVAQALVATAALTVRELHLRRTAKLAMVGLPGAIAATLVATAPHDAVVLAGAAALALITLALSATWPAHAASPA